MASTAPFVCRACARSLHRSGCLRTLPPTSAHVLARSRQLSSRPATAAQASPPPRDPETPQNHDAQQHDAVSTSSTSLSNAPPAPTEQGPMSRRLQEATEEALLTGGRAGRRAVEDAGFSHELKAKLLEKLADAQFRTEHLAAFTEAGITGDVPEAAGHGTRALASAQPWTGEETPEDAVLRMLDDARKPLAPKLRGKPKIPSPVTVDMRLRPAQRLSPGQRAASARDKAQTYTGMGLGKDGIGLSNKEREAFRKEYRERFALGARAMPNTITGLAALANERIEDAITRGQFKDIPRGKSVERDTRANNPFIDTTEYILNNMIKRQEIVPPWIEKQQELLKAATVFRSRLRNDWERHAARMIASRGGSLQEQTDRARAYAQAEEVHNPRRRNIEQTSIPTNTTDDIVMARIRQEGLDSATTVSISNGETPPADDATNSSAAATAFVSTRPYRDPDWEAAERSYMGLAITNLNAITRSYNLMAPELAKKPYFSLQRELNNCYADVAPKLASVIQDRATRPTRSPVDVVGKRTRTNSILGRLGGDGVAVEIRESKEPHYGLKEMWRDFWAKPK
ncbi:hypothetical protein B0T26DRAFT_655778 [Lasiosphaeria miniovina]|uniref:DnaJ homologue subfamily C member 28 conserved domain-containing protein n=1 Tax=Lasiosphaeria miniovina TaxID=1954250 RepID=A0AA40DLZ5_9PEZI|nr:uncharacterized protein B0T26DRAFT_655778 [Lasiosphaeria miniovina]KAK0706131.1 hypothetical protein B0T26DRAFT_655778 [Lasiosphaeria miniovina]